MIIEAPPPDVQPHVLTDVFDALDLPVIAIDKGERIVAVNAAARGEYERLFGAAPMAGLALAEVLAHRPAELAVLTGLCGRALAGETLSVEQDFDTEPGQRRSYEISFKPLRDGSGAVMGACMSMLDVTGRFLTGREVRRLNQELARRVAEQTAARRLNEELFRATFEHAPVGIAHLDMDGRWLRLNPRLSQITGYSADELARMTFQDITHPDDLEADLGQARRLANGEIPSYKMEKRYVRKDGTVVWVLLTGTIVRSRPPYFIAVVEDISDRKVTEAMMRAGEEKQRQLAMEAERASLSKSKFLAAASHDLRQPAQSLALFASVLEQRLAGTPEESLVGKIMQSIDGLRVLLDSLLDISKLDAGIVIPAPTQVALGELLDRLGAEYAITAESQDLKFRTVRTSLITETDPVLLERIVRNLIENALRYTHSGGVLVGCRRRPGAVAIEVVDTGIGIPADQIEAVFEEFHQVGNPHRDRSQGLGLGLAIVRRLAGLLGHPVAVSSVPGKGTRFSVTVPRVE